MFYEFPLIRHIDDVLPAIEGCDEFKVIEKNDEAGEYTAIDYMVVTPDSFPSMLTDDPELRLISAIRRECRGIKFYKNGIIAARPYHKFHNLNERDETLASILDWTSGYMAMSKLDGSMIHPIVIDGKVFLCTKLGYTEVAKPVQDFMLSHESAYVRLCLDLHRIVEHGATPVFEWCSRKQKIVVDYPEDMLVLTAIRDNYSGNYWDYETLTYATQAYGIPVVDAWRNDKDIDQFVEEIRHREGEEGCVFRFNNGHMVKIKNEWYLRFHRALNLLRFEKDVIFECLNSSIDDLLPMFSEEDRKRLIAFDRDLMNNIKETAHRLTRMVLIAKIKTHCNKRKFATEAIHAYPSEVHGLLYKVWDGSDAYETVYNYVNARLHSQTRVNEARHAFGGISWYEY